MGGFASLQSNIHGKHKKQTQKHFHAEYDSLTVTGSLSSVVWSTHAICTYAAHGKPRGLLCTDAYQPLADIGGIRDKHRIINGFAQSMTVPQTEFTIRAM